MAAANVDAADGDDLVIGTQYKNWDDRGGIHIIYGNALSGLEVDPSFANEFWTQSLLVDETASSELSSSESDDYFGAAVALGQIVTTQTGTYGPVLDLLVSATQEDMDEDITTSGMVSIIAGNAYEMETSVYEIYIENFEETY